MSFAVVSFVDYNFLHLCRKCEIFRRLTEDGVTQLLKIDGKEFEVETVAFTGDFLSAQRFLTTVRAREYNKGVKNQMNASDCTQTINMQPSPIKQTAITNTTNRKADEDASHSPSSDHVDEIGLREDSASDDEIITRSHKVVALNYSSDESNMSHHSKERSVSPEAHKSGDPASEIMERKTQRQKDFCFFCEHSVLNFARHLLRHHSLETEVQEILSKPKNSVERKQLITNIRKKGNYLCSTFSDTMKPVNKGTKIKSQADFLPCPHCLGMYSRKQLWRHRNNCIANKNKIKGRVQGSSQNLIVKYNPLLDAKLKEKVFPRMRADDISLVAKADRLICAFGSQYMKTHKEDHFINVTSRKMRELARLVIEMRKTHPEKKNLIEFLQLQYFDSIVNAVKLVANFDSATETYCAPTYAMNISTSIKMCCDIAKLALARRHGKFYGLQLQDKEFKENVNELQELISSQWKFEISTTAAKDLTSKKWNKVTIIPFASDLKILKDYLTAKASTAAEELQANTHDSKVYLQLLELVYCRVLLLNRRRPGELQRLPLHVYESSMSQNQSYEEFGHVVSETEKILLKRFKRVVIRGKRDKGVPVLLDDDVQRHISLLLSVRQNVVDSSVFLFAKPGSGKPLDGYKVLEKYAHKCGAKNPKALTATKLRKHLATVTQMFSMSQNDMEQLANFMGHTLGIHHKSYRLPDDVFQTAKISKLLVLMEKGGASSYKGKKLDEIDVNMDSDLLAEENTEMDNVEETELENIGQASYENVEQPPSHENSEEPQPSTSRVVKVPEKVPWTLDQKREVAKFFRNHIKNKKPPKKHECEKLIEESKILGNKDWVKIKVLVQNIYTKKCKMYL